MPSSYYLTVLEKSFSLRKEKNLRYSLRAYAAYLGIHSSALSRILQGKQPLSKKNSVQIAKKLKLSHEEQRLFLQSVAQTAFIKDCAEMGQTLGLDSLTANPKPVSNEVYATIASVSCIAITQLLHTKDFRYDVSWIAKRLGISVKETEKCLQALIESGVVIQEGDRLVHTDARHTAIDPASTSKIRQNMQKEIVALAGESIEKDPLPYRGHYGMTMAIDPKKIGEAKRMISEFIETLCDYLGAENPTEVYQLGVQLFPLSRTITEK